MPGPLFFWTRRYAVLARDVMKLAGGEEGALDAETFPDGERYRRLRSNVERRSVVLLGGTVDDEATMELFDLACGVVMCGAARLTIVLPYFGYSTMERATKSGEIVTAKNRARLLSAIPQSPLQNRVVCLDLHAEGITHYFEGAVRPVHVYAKPVIIELARALGGQEFVLACTDAGRAKWVESLANDLGVGASFVFKRRTDGRTTEVTGVSADVVGKHVVVYDDMIRTGSSLLGAAKAYRAAGAVAVSAVATHGLFPEDSLAKILASGLIDKVACTDSHPRARELEGAGAFRVASVAPVLAAAI